MVRSKPLLIHGGRGKRQTGSVSMSSSIRKKATTKLNPSKKKGRKREENVSYHIILRFPFLPRINDHQLS